MHPDWLYVHTETADALADAIAALEDVLGVDVGQVRDLTRLEVGDQILLAGHAEGQVVEADQDVARTGPLGAK